MSLLRGVVVQRTMAVGRVDDVNAGGARGVQKWADGRCGARRAVIVLTVALTLSATFLTPSFAQQSDPGCDIANALLGALLKSRPNTPCTRANEMPAPQSVSDALSALDSGPAAATPAPATAQPSPPSTFTRRGRSVDIPENLALLKSKVKGRLETLDPLRASDIQLLSLCAEEMKPLGSMRDIIDSGYDELKAKCEAGVRQDVQQYRERKVALSEQRRQAQIDEAARAEAAAQQKKDEADRQAIAELRTGKRQPVNCAQWMVVKGHELKDLNARVTEVSYQPPRGIGNFSGRVEQINGDTMLLSDQPIMRMPGSVQGYMAIKIDRHAQLFNADQIKINSIVEGYATQVGTRNVRLTSGSSRPTPELLVSCMHVLF